MKVLSGLGKTIVQSSIKKSIQKLDLMDLKYLEMLEQMDQANESIKVEAVNTLKEIRDVIAKYGYTESIHDLFGAELKKHGISGKNVDQQITAFLKDNNLEQYSTERLTDLFNNSWLIFNDTGSLSQVIAMIKAVDDIDLYIVEYLPKLSNEQLQKNIETRMVRSYPASILIPRLKGVNDMLIYLKAAIVDKKKINGGNLKRLAANMGIPTNLWEKITDSLPLVGNIKRDTLSDHGYDVADLKKIHALVTFIKPTLKQINNTLSIFGNVKGDLNIEKDENSYPSALKSDIKKVIRQINRIILTHLLQARYVCKQMVFSNTHDNIFKR